MNPHTLTRPIVPAAIRLLNLLAVALLLLALPAQAFQWNKTRGPEGAWVTGLDEASDGTLWLAARGGGVYSKASSGDWTARNTGLTRTDLVDLVVANDGTPVAATATSLFRFVSGNWVAANSGIPFSTNSNVNVTSLKKLANGNLILSANSVYRSTDNGQTWTETTSGMAGTVVLGTRLVQSRLVVQDSNGNLYAGTTDFGNPVYVSLDGGATWTNRSSGISLPISMVANADGAVLAYMAGGNVFRTTNQGTSWSQVSNFGSAVPGGLHSALHVSGSEFIVGQGGNTFITSSLTRSTNGTRYNLISNLNIAGAALNQQGAAALVLRRTSNGTLLAGFNGAGVWRSTDSTTWTPMNTGLDAAIVNTLYGAPGSLLAGARGTGNHCTTDGGMSWTNTNYTLQSADVQAYLKPSTHNRLLLAGIIRNVNTQEISSSTNGGATWSGLRSNRIGATTRLLQSGTTLYASGAGSGSATNAYQQSTDGGATWSTLNGPASGGEDIAADTAGNLYIIASGTVQKRAVGQTSWVRIDNVQGNGLPTPAVFGSLLADDSANLYLVTLSAPTGTPGVYVSTNGGSNWALRSSGLPTTQIDLGLANLRFEKGPDGSVYLLSKQAGLFRSTNAGTSWVNETGNLPTPAADPSGVRGLLALGFAADGTVFAGLEGAGVWVAGALGSGSSASGVNCARASGMDPDLDAGYGSSMGYSVFPDPSADVRAQIHDAQDRLLVVSTGDALMGLRVSRVTAAGQLDTSYGENGTVLLNSNLREPFSFTGLVMQESGKLVLAKAFSDNDVIQCRLIRLNTDGSLDNSFGNNGQVVLSVSGSTGNSCTSVTVASDGDLVVAGSVTISNQQIPMAVFRFSADGVADTSFDGDGIFIYPEHSGGGLSIVALEQGAVLVTGRATTSSSVTRGVAFRLSASGVRDSSFGTSGEINLGNGVFEARLSRHAADGRFAVLLNSGGPLRAYTAEGLPLPGFGTNGVQTITPPTLPSSFRYAAVRYRSDASLVLSGTGSDNNLGVPYVVLLNADGSFNTQWGDGGVRFFLANPNTATRPCPTGATTEGLSLDAMGRVVIAASCGQNSQSFTVTDTVVLRTRTLPAPSNVSVDTVPDAFSFMDATSVTAGSVQTSNSITVTGIDAPASLSVTGGEYSLGCNGTFASTGTTVNNNQTLCVRHTASGQASTTVDTVLSIGGVSDTFSSTTAADTTPADTTPAAFSFSAQTGVDPLETVTSNSITVADINAPATISVSNGSYALGCTGSFITSSSTISNGQSVCVRHTASSAFSSSVSSSLSIGGVSASFTSTTRAADVTPAPFNFVDQNDVEPGSTVTSAPVTVSGIEAPVAISVSNGSYAIGCGATYVSTSGTVSNGQQVCVRHTAANGFSTAVETVLTVGGETDTFTSVTRAEGPDSVPAPFSFPAVSDVEPASVVESASITVSGINVPSNISVTGGEYRIGNGAYTAAAGQVSNGQTVRVRLTSAAYGANAVATLNIGGISASFTVSSRMANQDRVPDARGREVLVTSSSGTLLNLSNTPASPAGALPRYQYRNGFFSFDVDVAERETITVTLDLPPGSRPAAYVKCDAAGLVCTPFAGAVIVGNRVTLTLTDGGDGDSDGMEDGMIRDPGAPGYEDDEFSFSSGGGSFGLWSLLLALPALLRRRGALALLMGALALPATAAQNPFYLGLRTGSADTHLDSAGLTAELQARGHAVTATVDDRAAGGTLYLGYVLQPGAALELGLMHSGEFETRVSGAPADPARMARDAARLLGGSGNAVSAALRFDLPLVGALAFAPRVGLYGWQTEVEIGSGGGSMTAREKGIGGLFGLGFTLRLPAGWRVGLGYELLRSTTNHSIEQVQGQVEWQWGH